MRVSIWQQFSSNHSGGFSLIGEFKTIEEAENAVAIMKSMISMIAKWYKDHFEELDKQLRKFSILPLTPVEEELAKQYGLTQWEYSVDWAETEANEALINQGLYHYRNLVFLSDPIETWCDAQPFDELLEKLGARIEVHSATAQDDIVPVVYMTCYAPNETTAAEIVRQLSSSKTFITVPNVRSYPGEISHVDSKIECQELEIWHQPHISEFLDELVPYLEAQECKNFEFSISHRLHED
jgi:hypothetical protein